MPRGVYDRNKARGIAEATAPEAPEAPKKKKRRAARKRGTLFVTRQLVCSGCAQPVDDEWTFCPGCGGKFSIE